MQLFYQRSGDGHTVDLPNDIDNLKIAINGQDIVSVAGTYSGDGRVSDTTYRIDVQKGDEQTLNVLDNDSFDYIEIVERGVWRGDMRLTVITLTEVKA